MAKLSKDQVIGMLFEDDLDSGDESDIHEDLAFPLPAPGKPEDSPSPQLSLLQSGRDCSDDELFEGEDEAQSVSEEFDREELERGRMSGRRGRAASRGRAMSVRGTGARDRSPHARGNLLQ